MYTNRSHLACHGYTHWSLRSISGQRKATQIKVDRRLLGCIMMYRHVSFGSSQNEVSVILFFSRAPDILADHLLPRVAVQLELPAGFNWLLGWWQLVMCWFFICSKEKWNSTCRNFSFDLFLFSSFEACSSCFYICGFCNCSSFLPDSYVLFSQISPRFSTSHLHMCTMFFLHNGNSSILGSFLGCSKIWMMGNPVDTPKFGGYEPWFPCDIPSKSTHHFPWGHGGEVFNARDVLLGLQEFNHIPGYPTH